MIAVPRSHLLHKQFPARRARLFISRRSPHAKIPIRRTSVGGGGMGHFHAEGDCVSRSRGGMAKAGVGGDQSSRERGGRKDGCRLGVVGQNERKAAQRGHYPAGLLVHARMNECPRFDTGQWASLLGRGPPGSRVRRSAIVTAHSAPDFELCVELLHYWTVCFGPAPRTARA